MSERAKSPARGRRRLLAPTNLLTSLILVFPLFIFYQIAVRFVPGAGNGADLITPHLFALLEYSSSLYLIVNLVLALVFVVLVLILKHRQRFDLRLFFPVLLESGIYALTMGSVIIHLMGFIGINPSLALAAAVPPGEQALVTRLVLSIGAGVHEELVFRLLMLSGAVALLGLFGFRRWLAVVLAFIVTALLFSAAHHVIGGEAWRFGVFTYRFFSGIVFAAIYQWRGFAVAVYTHALYDVYVTIVV